MKTIIKISILVLLFASMFSSVAYANGFLSENIRIKSDTLGYDLQYRVYLPSNIKTEDKLPTLYITDGASYAKKSRMIDALDRGIALGKIKPVIAVFVDARDPDNLKVNRRNEQFFCEKNMLIFLQLN